MGDVTAAAGPEAGVWRHLWPLDDDTYDRPWVDVCAEAWVILTAETAAAGLVIDGQPEFSIDDLGRLQALVAVRRWQPPTRTRCHTGRHPRPEAGRCLACKREADAARWLRRSGQVAS